VDQLDKLERFPEAVWSHKQLDAVPLLGDPVGNYAVDYHSAAVVVLGYCYNVFLDFKFLYWKLGAGGFVRLMLFC